MSIDVKTLAVAQAFSEKLVGGLFDNYSESKSYSKGELVLYKHILYQFNADKAAGAWDSSKATAVDMSQIIELINSKDYVETVVITDLDITISQVNDIINEINEKGKHVIFDLHAFKDRMYVSLISISEKVIVNDLINGAYAESVYDGSMLLADLINTGREYARVDGNYANEGGVFEYSTNFLGRNLPIAFNDIMRRPTASTFENTAWSVDSISGATALIDKIKGRTLLVNQLIDTTKKVEDSFYDYQYAIPAITSKIKVNSIYGNTTIQGDILTHAIVESVSLYRGTEVIDTVAIPTSILNLEGYGQSHEGNINIIDFANNVYHKYGYYNTTNEWVEDIQDIEIENVDIEFDVEENDIMTLVQQTPIQINVNISLFKTQWTESMNNTHKYLFSDNGTVSYKTNIASLNVVGGEDKLVDLTVMFGAGNEPANVDKFNTLYNDWKTWGYKYGLVNFVATGLKTNGFNQWDEEWELGDFDNTTGAKIPSTQRIRSKNPIPVFPNTQYYFNSPNYGKAVFLDEAERVISVRLNFPTGVGTTPKSLFTTPNNCRFMYFTPVADYGTIYNNDICINISWSGYRNNEYESYWESNLQLPLNRYFINGMKSVGNTYDELTKDKSIQRIGVRSYEEGDEELPDVITDKVNTYYILEEPIVIDIEMPSLVYKVDDFGTEEIVSNSITAPASMDIVYALDYEANVRNLDINYGTKAEMNTKVSKVVNAVEGNVPVLDENGSIADSGISPLYWRVS